MPRKLYVSKNFRADARQIIAVANQICAEYAAQGFDLTLRQLYYQFVARDYIPNNDKEYNRLGKIISDARLAGLLDWRYIVDRTRDLRKNSHWDSPADILEAVAQQYQIDKWQTQEQRVEVWIEKDALIGVIEDVCRDNDVSYFSCRGYVSQSEMWAAAQRIGEHIENGNAVTILHLGDHDPSGIDMTRDIEDRITTFIMNDWRVRNADTKLFSQVRDEMREHCGRNPFHVERIALTFDQVEQYGPPPNPAKMTDSRYRKYIEEYGDDSWELDALEPQVLVGLIEDGIEGIRDEDLWQEQVDVQNDERRQLLALATGFRTEE